MRFRVLGPAALTALVVLSLGWGSAAGLAVQPGTLDVALVGHPCPGPATATAASGSGVTYTAVALTFPEGCPAGAVDLRMQSGATVRTGSAVAGGTSVVLPLDAAYDASATWAVEATVDGWHLPVTWSWTPPAPVVRCTVVDAEGQPVQGRPCTVTSLTSTHWGVPGSRYANLYVGFSATGVRGTQRIEFTVDLAAAGLPASWSWPTSAPRVSDNYEAPGLRCSDLPFLSARTRPGWGTYPSVYIPLVENRGLVSDAACS